MDKLKVGIVFGGSSREREISFAGGRTVYDNLNKALFEPILLFIDSFGNFCELDWQYVYKGTIRDFYPPVEFLPQLDNNFQVYAESLLANESLQIEMLERIGKPIKIEELKNKIDLAFLCLHGTKGEDGSIQGLLDWLNIPFTGSGIMPSALGINKRTQKDLLIGTSFNNPVYASILRKDWLQPDKQKEFHLKVSTAVGFPCVVKAANQGSSIGITILQEDNYNEFEKAVNKSFFIENISKNYWESLSENGRIERTRSITDIREGLGLPLLINGKEISFPAQLIEEMDLAFNTLNEVELCAVDTEVEVIIEQFIEGKEFSCIVVKDDSGNAIALPPTEIVKGKEVFDYRSKYMPGLTRKITPMRVEDSALDNIRKECVELFKHFQFNVYARIDGFLTADGEVFLNDPNTTSGMMPSSFFFHQAAEIGLNPSNFITYLIRTSLAERANTSANTLYYTKQLEKLDTMLSAYAKSDDKKEKVAVIMGGYSFERHISVESGRNIYEKLASSGKYEVLPIFLTGNDEKYSLYKLPINVMLKDNADDIRDKVLHYESHPYLEKIQQECSSILEKYGTGNAIQKPVEISFQELSQEVDGVFVALHGRPGEDGSIQKHLKKVGLYFNGSDVESSQITINKYTTSLKLRDAGFLTADAILVEQDSWTNNRDEVLQNLESWYPLIAKPADDGCSAAVKKIDTPEELSAFANLIFRTSQELEPLQASILGLKPKEEFPQKKYFLVEKLIQANGADHFLEITGGLLTHKEGAGIRYEIFEPSEALAEHGILSLEEKFLAGQGQNLTPSRFSKNKDFQASISAKVQKELVAAAKALKVEGYCRIDAFVRIFNDDEVEVIFIEVNSLPGMTPATCIYHQAAINGYKPFEFIDEILEYGRERNKTQVYA